jgi:hypothetical protein
MAHARTIIVTTTVTIPECRDPQPAEPARLDLHVSRVQGRRTLMPPIERPLLELVDVEYSVLSIAPKDGDGRLVREPRTYDWIVTDQVPDDPAETGDVAGLEQHPEDVPAGSLPEWVRRVTSGAPGTAKVHVLTTLADGSALEEIIPVRIKVGEPNALNLSAGPPQHE